MIKPIQECGSDETVGPVPAMWNTASSDQRIVHSVHQQSGFVDERIEFERSQICLA